MHRFCKLDGRKFINEHICWKATTICIKNVTKFGLPLQKVRESLSNFLWHICHYPDICKTVLSFENIKQKYLLFDSDPSHKVFISKTFFIKFSSCSQRHLLPTPSDDSRWQYYGVNKTQQRVAHGTWAENHWRRLQYPRITNIATSALKTEALCFSDTLASTDESPRRQNPGHHHPHRCARLKALIPYR